MATSAAATLHVMIARTISAGRRLRSWLQDPSRRWRPLALALAAVAVATGLIYSEAMRRSAQTTAQPALQTTVARRGSIVLSASGTGTLEAARQSDLAFGTSGKLTDLYVEVGDQVAAGELLAELDNATQRLEYEQARAKLGSLTSVSAIGAAQKAMAAAAKKLRSAQLQLEYLISPDVYYWENEVAQNEETVKAAQKSAAAAPTDKDAQAKLKKARDLLGFGQDRLKLAQQNYHDYVVNTFTVSQLNHSTNVVESVVVWPTAAEILKAEQDVTIAQGAAADSQNLLAALTDGASRPDASGAGLLALEQARLDLQTAQQNLQATQLVAPFSGTIVSISGKLGPVAAVATPVGSTTTTNPVRSTAVMTLADLSKLYVQTYVDPSDYTLLTTGRTAHVIFDALPDATFTGKVAQVNPALDTSSGTAVVSGLVELDPTTTNLLLGMSGSVEVIAAEAQNAVIIPLAALHEYAPGKFAVFVMRGGEPMVQFVEVGLEDLVDAEIKSGLQVGDVVTTGLSGTR
jgi:HlyD family secretion protein